MPRFGRRWNCQRAHGRSLIVTCDPFSFTAAADPASLIRYPGPILQTTGSQTSAKKSPQGCVELADFVEAYRAALLASQRCRFELAILAILFTDAHGRA